MIISEHVKEDHNKYKMCARIFLNEKSQFYTVEPVLFMLVRDKLKHHENGKKLPWEHVIGCWDVKLCLLKYVTITTATMATVT